MFCRYVFKHAHARHVSTKPSFPFPTTPNPTPHQIFHLPRNAPQSDIKARYFDLVRIYHPDKVDQSIPSGVAHARFQAITTAYNSLRGTLPASAQEIPPTPSARAMYKRNRNLYTGPQLSDDSWKDRIIVAGIIVAVFCFAMQTAATRRAFIVEAMTTDRPSTTPATRSNTSPIEDARLAEPGS
ncbi:hypothetical protein DFH07DRAFT_133138 [Mycena maculata]|uniref:J domain-containing protein n=1 Tax=Mycena maculata TaxID=230809 RepID=A0AAD7I2P7_9AGAR|nr:hypothetical protein DFH07DRAFT_133138 [Mycena maculata]